VFSKSDPYHTAVSQNHAWKIGCKFFIAAGKYLAEFYFIEKYLSEMPFSENMPVIFTGFSAAVTGGNVRNTSL